MSLKIPTKLPNPQLKRQKFDRMKALQLRHVHGMSYNAIAEHFGVTRQSVYQAIGRWEDGLYSKFEVQASQNSLIQRLYALRDILMLSLGDRKKIDRASLNNVAYAFSQINQALRLEEGQSTENLNVHTLPAEISELEQKLKEVSERIERTQNIVDVTP